MVEKPKEKTKVDVIFCIPGNNFSGKFFDCFLNLLNFCNQKRIKYLVSRDYSSVVHFARAKVLGASNDGGKRQAPFQGRIDYDYLMLIDSDIVFDPEHFMRLISHEKDIVAGPYMMQDCKNLVVVKEWDTDFFDKYGTFQFMTVEDLDKEKKQNEGLFEVSYVGMGWMCISKGVFENIDYPWFYPDLEIIGERIDMTSEDVAFCRKAQRSGFKIYVDAHCRVGHEKALVI